MVQYNSEQCTAWLLNPAFDPKTGKQIINGEDIEGVNADKSVFVDLATSTIKHKDALEIYKLNEAMFVVLGLDKLFTPKYDDEENDDENDNEKGNMILK
jgi:hypothetical protein